MEMTKEGFLRPFDLKIAKEGAKVLIVQSIKANYVDGPNSKGEIVLRGDNGDYHIRNIDEELHMAPLCWVEDKPVYPGDTLYWSNNSSQPGVIFTVGKDMLNEESAKGISVFKDGSSFINGGMKLGSLTWNKPARKVKKTGWMNTYLGERNIVYPNREAADDNALETRKQCIEITWEQYEDD